MTIPTISTLPTAPARTDAPATFISRADAFLGALVTMQSELNTSIGAMNTDISGIAANVTAAQAAQTAAELAETNAEAAQAAAEAASSATLWVSGTSYSSGDVVYSPIDYKSYRANTATSGTTDPSLSADWDSLSYELPSQTGNAGKFLSTDGTNESWTEAGGGAWELLATYNPSGASSLDIEDFSSTYDDYVILINNLESSSSSTALRSYFKLNGSYFTGGSNEYMYNIQYNAATASSTVSNGGSNGTSFQYATVMGALGEPNNAIAYIQNVNETGIRHSYHVSTQSTSIALIAKWESLLSVNSSISGANLTELQGIRFFASGFTFSGTFKVYGIKKA